MVARATRVDPHAGRYEDQRALVFHPDDPLFAGFRRRIETEQGTLARRPKEGRRQSSLPLGLLHQLPPAKEGITPLTSNALAMRRPESEEAQGEMLETPSLAERRLRARLGEMVAIQAVEDEAGRAGHRAGVTGPGIYHRCNACLKRVMGSKSRRRRRSPNCRPRWAGSSATASPSTCTC
jgi:hypothetical protein